MKFDIFCEIQIAEPWPADHETRIFKETLEQARVADAQGFEIWWQVEHHGSPAFSYSSAPDLMLGAIAHHTKRMHIGQAGSLAPFKINHPMRAAERAATLDILSGGRFELGLARSGGKEWETFGAEAKTTAAELKEAMHMIPQMWTQENFSWNSDLLKIPEREVTPHPLQKPHPRMWQTAGSPESFRSAGEFGVGVLGTTLLSPVDTMKNLLDIYSEALAKCTKPVGQFYNRDKGIFTFVNVAESRKQSIEAGAAWSALWYVHQAPLTFKVPRSVWYDAILTGLHPNAPRPSTQQNQPVALSGEDPTDLTIYPEDIPVIVLLKKLAKGEKVSKEEAHECLEELDSVIIGDPDACLKKFKKYEAIGTDRMMCLMQFGSIPHEAVMRSMRLTGEHLIPFFANRKAAAE